MALKAVATKDELAQMPEAIRPLYAETDGIFALAVEPAAGWELANTQGLKTALQKERAAREDFERKIKPFEGLDPEKAREALGKMAEIASWDPDKKLAEAKAQFEKQLREQYDLDHQKFLKKNTAELEAATSRSKSLYDSLDRVLRQERATQAIAAAKGSVPLLLPPVMARLRMREVDGKHIVEVIDDEGVARLSPKPGSQALMTPDELVQEMRGSEAFARAFDATGASGSGATPPGGGSGGVDLSKLSPVERLKALRRQGAKP